MNIAILLFIILYGQNYHPPPTPTHRHHVRRIHHHPRMDGTIFHNDPRFHHMRQWCQEHTDSCVRVGNTYIIQ